MDSLRDAAMLAVLPVLVAETASPRRTGWERSVVAKAYAVADEVMLQRSKDAQDSPWVAPEAIAASGIAPEIGPSGCIGDYRYHRWNTRTGVCDRCMRQPHTRHEHDALKRLRSHEQSRLRLLEKRA